MGEPLAPLANIPSRVGDLTVVQRGTRILARFTVPKLTTEGATFKSAPALDLRIGPIADPFVEKDWVTAAMPVAEGPVANGVASYEIPATAWTGKLAVVGVRATGTNKKSSGWIFQTIHVVTPPQIPADVRAEATAEGVQLTWRAEGAAFRIFRRSGKEDFVPAGDASQSPWTDTSSVFGMPYTYRVQTILKLEDNREAESDLSAAISITPQDRFPPAVPVGLRATAAGDSVELSWEGNTEGDLAGYRVYRAEGAGAFEKIADSAIPAYADHAVEHGKSYRYEVTSLDQSGNESAPSPVADIALE